MSESRRVDIREQKPAFKGFFKINQLEVAHERFDGVMSEYQQRLVFERGDSVAVLIFNRDTGCVVLVDQFRAPTLNKGRQHGWITETVAGTREPSETGEATAIRETMEETGYQIEEPRLIATFFSSPGGSSERISLYFAEVGNKDKVGRGGGKGDEDIRVREIPFDELIDQIWCKDIEDSKLLIAALLMQEDLRGKARRPLSNSSVSCDLKDNPSRSIGYKTGPINGLRGVSIWVNSENEDMIMDRFIGRSISANIRYLGAGKDNAGNVTEDTVNNELIRAVGNKAPVRIGTVFETEPGVLKQTHGVQAIFHVATVRGVGAGQGFKADLGDLSRCVKNVLLEAHKRNERWRRKIGRLFGSLDKFGRAFWDRDCESILIPILGAGDGGMQVEDVVPRLFDAAVQFFQEHPTTMLKEVYFLAFTAGHKSACDREFARLRREGIIV